MADRSPLDEMQLRIRCVELALQYYREDVVQRSDKSVAELAEQIYDFITKVPA